MLQVESTIDGICKEVTGINQNIALIIQLLQVQAQSKLSAQFPNTGTTCGSLEKAPNIQKSVNTTTSASLLPKHAEGSEPRQEIEHENASMNLLSAPSNICPHKVSSVLQPEDALVDSKSKSIQSPQPKTSLKPLPSLIAAIIRHPEQTAIKAILQQAEPTNKNSEQTVSATLGFPSTTVAECQRRNNFQVLLPLENEVTGLLTADEGGHSDSIGAGLLVTVEEATSGRSQEHDSRQSGNIYPVRPSQVTVSYGQRLMAQGLHDQNNDDCLSDQPKTVNLKTFSGATLATRREHILSELTGMDSDSHTTPKQATATAESRTSPLTVDLQRGGRVRWAERSKRGSWQYTTPSPG